jgi:hypothetical protein
LPSIAPSANASPALAAQSRQLAMQIIELPDWTPVTSGIDTAAVQPGKSI